MNDMQNFFIYVTFVVLAFGAGYLAHQVSQDPLTNVRFVNVTNTVTLEKQPIYYTTNNTVVYNNTIVNISSKTINTESKSEFWNVIFQNSEEKQYVSGIFDSINLTNKDYADLTARGYQVDRYATYFDKQKTFKAIVGAYIFIEPVTGTIILPAEYAKYGINNGRLRQYDGTTNNYDDSAKLNKTSITICKGIL